MGGNSNMLCRGPTMYIQLMVCVWDVIKTFLNWILFLYTWQHLAAILWCPFKVDPLQPHKLNPVTLPLLEASMEVMCLNSACAICSFSLISIMSSDIFPLSMNFRFVKRSHTGLNLQNAKGGGTTVMQFLISKFLHRQGRGSRSNVMA